MGHASAGILVRYDGASGCWHHSIIVHESIIILLYTSHVPYVLTQISRTYFRTPDGAILVTITITITITIVKVLMASAMTHEECRNSFSVQKYY